MFITRKNYHRINYRIEQLERNVKRLSFLSSNPPKYNIGFEDDNFIVTARDCLLEPCFLTGEYFYEWRYNVYFKRHKVTKYCNEKELSMLLNK